MLKHTATYEPAYCMKDLNFRGNLAKNLLQIFFAPAPKG